MHDFNLPQTPDTQQVGPLGLRRRHRLSAWRSGSTPGSDGMRQMVLRTPAHLDGHRKTDHGLAKPGLPPRRPYLSASRRTRHSDRVTTNTTSLERLSQELLSLPRDTLPDQDYVLHEHYVAERTHFTQSEERAIQKWRDRGAAGGDRRRTTRRRDYPGSPPLHGCRERHAVVRATLPYFLAIQDPDGCRRYFKTSLDILTLGHWNE